MTTKGTMMITVGEIMGRHGVRIPAHLVADAEIPVLAGLQRQGDLLFIPARPSAARGERVGRDGVALVRGENGGNTHMLAADGTVTWRAVAGTQTLGTFTVEAGAAIVLHPEHGAQGFAPGCYIVRRQREQADEIRTVAD